MATKYKKQMLPKKVNNIAILLDDSGSMRCIADETLKAINDQIKTIKENAKRTKQRTLVSLYRFGSLVEREFFSENVSDIRQLKSFEPDGSTSLNDAVGDSVRDIESLMSTQSVSEDASALIILITDGEENNSRMSTSAAAALIRRMTATDRWSFVFVVPPGCAGSVMTNYGVPSGNVREWEQTARGVTEYSKATASSIGTYFTSRSLGQTSTKTFYTDLTNTTSKAVSRALDDITSDVRVFTVKSEENIRDFVESHTNRSYVKGKAFYQLMKEEKKVQATKQIIVLDKTKNKYFGGDGARDLLGLPDKTVRVVPKNHSNFEIFVQSTSVNRKLPRGTKVVVVP